ncbi:MAG: alpha-ketoglutarate-dependent dioxygenase AlkB [Pseudomonadota bacterium]
MAKARSGCPVPETLPQGISHHPGFIDASGQRALLAELRAAVQEAPLVRPVTAWGKPMSVRMTSMGRVGWVIERGRYRYVDRHPVTGQPWPAIPAAVLEAWGALSGWADPPDCCLMNWYGEGAKMGLHRDADEGEAAFAAPVLSLSLGDPARFRIGGLERGGSTQSLILRSGDALVMGGASRLAYHGIDRVWFGEGDLLPDGGRINLTLRVVRSV